MLPLVYSYIEPSDRIKCSSENDNLSVLKNSKVKKWSFVTWKWPISKKRAECFFVKINSGQECWFKTKCRQFLKLQFREKRLISQISVKNILFRTISRSLTTNYIKRISLVVKKSVSGLKIRKLVVLSLHFGSQVFVCKNLWFSKCFLILCFLGFKTWNYTVR